MIRRRFAIGMALLEACLATGSMSGDYTAAFSLAAVASTVGAAAAWLLLPKPAQAPLRAPLAERGSRNRRSMP